MKQSSKGHFLVVGGGAAGFFAALRAKAVNPRLEVTILESASKVLGKVKISGGGRCNVTHACFDPVRLTQFYPRGAKELRGIFSRFSPSDTVSWFEDRGVRLKTEADGRMFPVTDDSQTIIDCLMAEARRLNVQIKSRCPVQSVRPDPVGGFWVTSAQETFHADAILLATGSNRAAYQWLEVMGHHIVAPVPSLFTANIPDPALHRLAGVTLPAVSLSLLAESGGKRKAVITTDGPLLITHWGLSGPAMLRLSAWGARKLAEMEYKALLKLDALPGRSQDELSEILISKKKDTPDRQLGSHSPFAELPKRFWDYLLERRKISGTGIWRELPNKECYGLAETLKGALLEMNGKSTFKEEFVTAGGVALKEVDFKTMQSKILPGLFFAGEILDIDGITGGFNFQNAWSTGWVAGSQVAESACLGNSK